MLIVLFVNLYAIPFIINNDFLKHKQQILIKVNSRRLGVIVTPNLRINLFTLPWEWCHDDAETSAINFNIFLFIRYLFDILPI